MANIKPALDQLFKLEFSSPRNALHINPGENGLTFMGIYQVANPTLKLWDIVETTLADNNGDIHAASEELYLDSVARGIVENVYKWNYWDKAKLDKVYSQKIAEEIFIFGVNAGMRTAIRKAQKLVGAVADGIVGSQTIEALNAFDEDKFDYAFDELEVQYYDDLIAKKPSFARFKKGWYNRASAV
jgi:lysozyme family protein